MNKGHDFGADCWSLGVLIFELLTGKSVRKGLKIFALTSNFYRLYKLVWAARACKKNNHVTFVQLFCIACFVLNRNYSFILEVAMGTIIEFCSKTGRSTKSEQEDGV